MGIKNGVGLARTMSAPSLPLLTLLVLCTRPTLATSNGTTPDSDDKVLQGKFEQYSLPYGVFGAVSHILTCYVILCHYYGRRPLAPWLRLDKELINMLTVAVSSIVSISLAIVTLHRVRESQPLVVLAALQVVISTMLDALVVHRYLKKQQGLIRGMVLWGAILYAVSYTSIYAIAQMSKSQRLKGKWGFISILLVVLACGSGTIAFITFIIWAKASCRRDTVTLHVLVVSGLVCSCSYFLTGDYGVAVITGSTAGIPAESVSKLYYVYWVVERIPFFTF